MNDAGIGIIIPLLFNTLTGKIENSYFHNPPKFILNQLKQIDPSIQIIMQQYDSITEEKLKKVLNEYNDVILGQETTRIPLISSIYRSSEYDTKVRVVLLYGPPGIGKTESINWIVNNIGQKIKRIQMTMLQTNDGAEYIFGTSHGKVSLAYDLITRESNYILLDEFDKVYPIFYNAFYQLFDESIFIDKNYEVNMDKAIIFLTTNYRNEEEIKKNLGEPLYSRLYKIIKYDNLGDDALVKLAKNEINKAKKLISESDKKLIDWDKFEDIVLKQVIRLENPRIVMNKIQGSLIELITEAKDN